MKRRYLPLLGMLPGLLAGRAAGAATLAEALRHWTGVTADVIGAGTQVRVELPPSSAVPMFTARAEPAQRAGDPGWHMSAIALPQPLHLRNGDTLTLRDQHADAWLGARTVQGMARYAGLTIDHAGASTRLDHATAAVDSTGGPVTLAVDLDGLHADGDHGGRLLPQRMSLRGHTTAEGAQALTAMFDTQAGSGPGREGSGRAPVTIDEARFDVGPARFSITGTVTIMSPRDRRGEIEVSAAHFGDLMQQMPMDEDSAKIYPALMVLRQMGQKRDGRLSWTVVFAGTRVLVNGLDIAPLLGL